MRKKILSLLLCVFMLGIMCGCGAEQSTSTKVELRDDPVKSSSDYASGSTPMYSHCRQKTMIQIHQEKLK